MQKFRDYLYCDENRLKSYISQIPELKRKEVSSSYEKETSVDGGINLAVAETGTKMSEKTSISYMSSGNNLENFINWINNRDNAINYNGESLDAQDKDKLIVLNGRISVPEMSANMEAINTLAKNTQLFDILHVSSEKKQMVSYIKESDNIPVLLEMDSDYIFNFCLKKEYLMISSDDFYDNIDDEINVIGKIEKINNTDDDIEIFDLTKEVFKLNRTVRRKLPKESLKDAIIYEKGPLVKIIPIIIYK